MERPNLARLTAIAALTPRGLWPGVGSIRDIGPIATPVGPAFGAAVGALLAAAGCGLAPLGRMMLPLGGALFSWRAPHVRAGAFDPRDIRAASLALMVRAKLGGHRLLQRMHHVDEIGLAQPFVSAMWHAGGRTWCNGRQVARAGGQGRWQGEAFVPVREDGERDDDIRVRELGCP